MKKLILVAVLVFVTNGLVYAKDYVVEKKAGEYDVKVKIDRNPPVVGDNTVEVEIKDPSGKHVSDAQVKIDYSMPAMPGMPPMNYKTEADPKGKVYTAKMHISMSGSWNVAVKITRDAKTSTMKFSMDAR